MQHIKCRINYKTHAMSNCMHTSLHNMVMYSVLHAMNACTLHGDKVIQLYGILVANVEKVQKVHDEINDLLK